MFQPSRYLPYGQTRLLTHVVQLSRLKDLDTVLVNLGLSALDQL